MNWERALCAKILFFCAIWLPDLETHPCPQPPTCRAEASGATASLFGDPLDMP